MNAIQFTVLGKAIGKPRARVTRNGTFTPQKGKDYERAVATYAKQAMKFSPPLASPVEVAVVVCFAPEKSWPAWKKAQALAGELAHTSKPDLDNIIKALKDAMNGIVYVDDSQVITLIARKRYGISDAVYVSVLPIGIVPIQHAEKTA